MSSFLPPHRLDGRAGHRPCQNLPCVAQDGVGVRRRTGAEGPRRPARLDLLRQLYQVPVEVDRGYLAYRRAASAFMRWQLRRGLLNPDSHAEPSSRSWRLLNESLLLDTSEASALAFGLPGEPRTLGAAATLEFIREPSARSWYRAHNLTIATAYLAHEDLARLGWRLAGLPR